MQTLACGFSQDSLVSANLGLDQLELLILAKAPSNVQNMVDDIAERFQSFERVGKVEAYLTTADVAVAFEFEGNPYIAYNADKIDRLQSEFGDIAVKAIFAHELAHIYLDHWHANSPRSTKELEADFLAGRVLQGLNVSKTHSRIAYDEFADENETDAYPSLDTRLSSLIAGWEKSCQFDPTCNPNAEAKQSQLDAARGNIVVDPIEIFPNNQSARYSRHMETMVDAIGIRVGTYLSSTGLQEIDSSIANVGFFPLQLGDGVFRSSPSTVFARGKEIDAIGIVMGDAQVDIGANQISLSSTFFVQGDYGGSLSHRHDIAELVPSQSIAPSVVAREYLGEDWFKMAVLAQISQNLRIARDSANLEQLQKAKELLLTFRSGLGSNDPALIPVERFLTEIESYAAE